jgi:hypothetical protein
MIYLANLLNQVPKGFPLTSRGRSPVSRYSTLSYIASHQHLLIRFDRGQVCHKVLEVSEQHVMVTGVRLIHNIPITSA